MWWHARFLLSNPRFLLMTGFIPVGWSLKEATVWLCSAAPRTCSNVLSPLLKEEILSVTRAVTCWRLCCVHLQTGADAVIPKKANERIPSCWTAPVKHSFLKIVQIIYVTENCHTPNRSAIQFCHHVLVRCTWYPSVFQKLISPCSCFSVRSSQKTPSVPCTHRGMHPGLL